MARYTEEVPWGEMDTLTVPEHNYMMKVIRMKAGHQCSLQAHQFKHESFVLISGEMEFVIEDSTGELRPIRVKPWDMFSIAPGVKHRMRAITDIIYVESSTHYPTDIMRFEDVYGRCP